MFTALINKISYLIKDRKQKQINEKSLYLIISFFHCFYTSTCLVFLLADLESEPFIPPEYQQYHQAFSKNESNVLSPFRLYDHKIILKGESEKSLKYSPLYKMSLKQFEIVKEYITDNLAKDFIELS